MNAAMYVVWERERDRQAFGAYVKKRIEFVRQLHLSVMTPFKNRRKK